MATVSDEPIVVVCANDEIAVVDTIPLNYDCPPILARFLGISRLSDEILSVFKAPDRDELGRLTFVKYFDISRSNFLACITFLRSGHVGSLECLVRTFDILGGCKKLDDYIAKLEAAEEARQAHQLELFLAKPENPTTPEEDTLNLYFWRAGQCTRTMDTGWTTTCHTGVSIDYWWRKRREPTDEDDSDGTN